MVYSTEPPIKPPAPDLGQEEVLDGSSGLGLSNKPGVKKIAPASVAFVPSVAGLVIASEVVRDLMA